MKLARNPLTFGQTCFQWATHLSRDLPHAHALQGIKERHTHQRAQCVESRCLIDGRRNAGGDRTIELATLFHIPSLLEGVAVDHRGARQIYGAYADSGGCCQCKTATERSHSARYAMRFPACVLYRQRPHFAGSACLSSSSLDKQRTALSHSEAYGT